MPRTDEFILPQYLNLRSQHRTSDTPPQENCSSPRRKEIEDRNFAGKRCIFPGTIVQQPMFYGLVPGFHHDSIYIGTDQVVDALGHFGRSNQFSSLGGVPLPDSLIPALNGGIYINPISYSVNNIWMDEGVPNITTSNKAHSMVGWYWRYHLTRNNCQHFTNWCRTGMFFSQEGNNTWEGIYSPEVVLPYEGLVPRMRPPSSLVITPT